MSEPHNQRAAYDEDGNIIIPDEGLTEGLNQNFEEQDFAEIEPLQEPQKKEIVWNTTDEPTEPVRESRIHRAEPEQIQEHVEEIPEQTVPRRPLLPGFKSMWKALHSHTRRHTKAIVQEGVQQYRSSAQDIHQHSKGIFGSMGSGLRSLGGFMAQPVWIVMPNRKPKKYNRATLFVLDVVRFGGTFATIFVALFITLNYQSFLQIAGEHLNPIRTAQQSQEEAKKLDEALTEKILKSPGLAVAGRKNGNVLSFLPQVGPPDNRIIIPKLAINIPLVTPSYDSLLKEDWEQVEVDIQKALEMGVVHYPGTARPGQAGNFFVTGHSSYYPWAPGDYKTIFARLHRLEPGDEYFVYHGGDKHRYIIREKTEVQPDNVSVLDQPVDQRIGTLMTCSPVGTTLRRLILVADEVDPVTGAIMAVGEQIKRDVVEVKPQALPI